MRLWGCGWLVGWSNVLHLNMIIINPGNSVALNRTPASGPDAASLPESESYASLRISLCTHTHTHTHSATSCAIADVSDFVHVVVKCHVSLE